jgi:uncharacterized membrane protein YkvA (DUF1232 family)
MIFGKQQKEKAVETAEVMADEFDAEETKEFANKHTKDAWYKDLKLLLDMILDPSFNVRKATYLIIAGALAYAVMPMDVIPDFIPGMGFVDDAFVLSSVLGRIAKEAQRYREHAGL